MKMNSGVELDLWEFREETGFKEALQKMWEKPKEKIELKPRDLPHVRLPDKHLPRSVFAVEKEIGKGNFSTVYKVHEKVTIHKRNLALKIYNKKNEENSDTNLRVVEREIAILSLVEHPNILQLLEVYETPTKVMLVCEYFPFSLSGILGGKRHLYVSEIRKVTKSIASALAYLHNYEIAHRDVKPENILISPISSSRHDGIGGVKLSDFGLAAARGPIGTFNKLKCFCGTLQYMAPEVLIGKEYTQVIDIWSLGVVFYQCFEGRLPFKAITKPNMIADISKKHEALEKTEGKLWRANGCELRDFLLSMLTIDPAERISAKDLLLHNWLQLE